MDGFIREDGVRGNCGVGREDSVGGEDGECWRMVSHEPPVRQVG